MAVVIPQTATSSRKRAQNSWFIGGDREIFHPLFKKRGGKCENKEWLGTFLLIKITKTIWGSVFFPPWPSEEADTWTYDTASSAGKMSLMLLSFVFRPLKENELDFWQHHLLSIICLPTCQDIVWSDLHLLTETCRWIPALNHLALALVLPTVWSRIPPFHPCFFLKPRIFSDSELLITTSGS